MGSFYMDGKGALKALAELDELIEWSRDIQRGGLIRDDKMLVRSLEIVGIDYKAINAGLIQERWRVAKSVRAYLDKEEPKAAMTPQDGTKS